MLASTVALLDVADVEGFVNATINRAKLILSRDEREELVCEGICIMQKLSRDYQPRMVGHATEGRFSGYAAMYLPRKLGDAWHRMHEEHQLVADPETGRRRWSYRERPVSLEAIIEDDGDRERLLADPGEPSSLKPRLFAALLERWTAWLEVVAEVGELLSQGATQADCAEVLGLTAAQVKEAVAAIAPVIGRLQSEET